MRTERQPMAPAPSELLILLCAYQHRLNFCMCYAPND